MCLEVHAVVSTSSHTKRRKRARLEIALQQKLEKTNCLQQTSNKTKGLHHSQQNNPDWQWKDPKYRVFPERLRVKLQP